MTRHTLPPLAFDLLDDPVVMAVMAADGIDKESVLAVLDHAAARLPQKADARRAAKLPRATSREQNSTASRLALIARTVLANASPSA